MSTDIPLPTELEAMWLYLMSGGDVDELATPGEGKPVRRVFVCRACDVTWQSIQTKSAAYPRNCWCCGKFGKNTGMGTYYFR